MKLDVHILLIMLLISTVDVAAVGANSVIVMEYFYLPPCHCSPDHMHEAAVIDELVQRLENEYHGRVRVEWWDVTTVEGSNQSSRYNITETPTIVVNHEYRITGEEITWDKLKSIVVAYRTGLDLSLVDKGNLVVTVPLIVVSGLVDGVNPCAFALLIFFLSFLYTVRRTRGNVLMMGSAYIFSLFAIYLAGGLGLLRTISFFGVEHMFAQIGIISIIILGLISIKDALMPGMLILKFPKRAVPKFKNLVERSTMPAAMILGGLVGLCAFPCSGGIYIGILSLLMVNTKFWEGLTYLVLYNIMFILPLIPILLFASNLETLTKMDTWRIEKRWKIRLISGVFMISLGLLTWYWITIIS